MTTKAIPAGVVGLGNMGAPMARNLARTGFLRALWNRTRARAEAVAQETGADIADSPAALAARCDVVLLSLSRDADVLEVVQALAPGLRAGAVVIDTSTVAVETARAAADIVTARGANFLDAPVSGGVEGAKNAQLVMMVGGDEGALARAQPVLAALARRVVHMGAVGTGQATKAVNQVMVAGINQAVTEALALGTALGLPMDKVVEVVGGGAAGNWFLTHRGTSMLAREFAPGFKLALHQKDLELCRQLAARFDAQLPIVEMTLVHYKRLAAEGFGEEDISALFRHKQRLFGGNK